MSVRVIYTCDKCGNEQHTSEQFWTVGVTAIPSLAASRQFVPGKSMQVCRACLESFGIYVQVKTGEPPAPVPTIEDLILEIVQRATEG